MLEDQAKFKNSQQRMREFKVEEIERQKGLKRVWEEERVEEGEGKRRISGEPGAEAGTGARINEEDPDRRTQHQEGQGSGLVEENGGG